MQAVSIFSCVSFEACFAFIIPIFRRIKVTNSCYQKRIFWTRISKVIQIYQQRIQSSLEIDLGVYKGLQN